MDQHSNLSPPPLLPPQDRHGVLQQSAQEDGDRGERRPQSQTGSRRFTGFGSTCLRRVNYVFLNKSIYLVNAVECDWGHAYWNDVGILGFPFPTCPHPSVASQAHARAQCAHARTSWPLRARVPSRQGGGSWPSGNTNGGDMPVATVLHGESPQLT